MFSFHSAINVGIQTTAESSIQTTSTSGQHASQPVELQGVSDGPLAEMLDRIGLDKLAAIRASAEFWPDRVEASSDIPSYLEWHDKVRPGGSAHQADQIDTHPGLYI